jgi:DNA repair exonuclease SbcCD nuclease subunit
MANLFNKALVITDIHFGLKSNSVQHNEDCLAFIHWATELALAQGCETCLFLGDYHNNRASINVLTLSYALRGLEHLNNNFQQVYFIPGNHDLYYRDRRDVQSVEWAKHLKNVTIVNDWLERDQVIIAPWLVGDDYKRIARMSGKYMFGHFELPGYLMNAMIEMPDHGEIRREHFTNFDHVFSGHFHKRQTKANITYIGNCFPHNYSDAGDDARGAMILTWGSEPEFYSWPDQPRYRVYELSKVLDQTERLLKPGMNVKINLDIDISYEEAGFIRDTFINDYQLRDVKLIPQNNSDFENLTIQGNVNFQSVDQIVYGQLSSIDSEHFDRRLLLEIYKNL